MRRGLFIRAALALLAAGLTAAGGGCRTFNATRDMEDRVSRHMAVADSLERAGNLQAAALEYALVAQHYGSSASHPAAVRKTALLMLDPRNPASNDSLALQWLNLYLHVPAGRGVNDDARIQISLLERITATQLALVRARAESDSLQLLIQRQNGTAATQGQRLVELEAQLRQARQELARLKEVDVQLSRTRRRP